MPPIRKGSGVKRALPRRGSGSPASVVSNAVTASSGSQSTRQSSRFSRDAYSPESSLTSLSPSPEPETAPAPSAIVISGQKLQPTVVFDTLWRWLVERKAIDDRRREGLLAPWTRDPILFKYKFCNAYRVLDRTSQFVITDVIEQGSQDRTELLFRILLFNCFNKIETWILLKDAFGDTPTYAAYNLAAYNKVLSAAIHRGRTLFTAAYMKIGKRWDYDVNHMRHLQLLEVLMRDLPPILDNARYAADVYEQVAAYPGMAAFTTYQLMLSLSYSPLLNFAANDFVVPGPGASSGLKKMFGASLFRAKEAVPDIETDILRWMATTQRTHFARLGLAFTFLRDAAGAERALDVADLEHAVCEVDKYARKAHPRVISSSGRTELRGTFRVSPGRLRAVPALPQAWADPARRVARVRPGPVEVEQRYCIVEVLAERAAPDARKEVHADAVEYQVTWLGYTRPTWEPRYSIAQDAPDLVEEYLMKKAKKAKKGKVRDAPDLVKEDTVRKGKKGRR
ncbi:hypothetical protein DFH09DRAFT_995662 [Mycena vulgaris]|nr:hypothetical protein DFH09DRAFT_995662 [Mycena vulgaris]